MVSKAELRYRARERLVQCLFQWDYSGGVLDDLVLCADSAEKQHPFDHLYFNAIKEAIRPEMDKIDAAIRQYVDRDMVEISKVELAVMRLACFEIMCRDDVPFKVAIDQAARLNKKFGTAHGHKYINAVLDAVAQEYRQLEYQVAQDKKGRT